MHIHQIHQINNVNLRISDLKGPLYFKILVLSGEGKCKVRLYAVSYKCFILLFIGL